MKAHTHRWIDIKIRWWHRTWQRSGDEWYTAVCVCVCVCVIEREQSTLGKNESWFLWALTLLGSLSASQSSDISDFVTLPAGAETEIAQIYPTIPLSHGSPYVWDYARHTVRSVAVTFKPRDQIEVVMSLFVSFQLPVANTSDTRSGKLQSHINRDHHLGLQ